MKKLRTSSGLYLHAYPMDDSLEYVKAGLDFNKKAGFDATDISLSRYNFSEAEWHVFTEGVLTYSEKIGIRCELCHLPFSGRRLCNEPDFIPVFNDMMHRAIDAAAMLGVDYAVMHPNTTTIPMKNYDRRAQYDSVMSHLSPFVEHANRVGLRVIVENMRPVPSYIPIHRYCQSPDELCEIADKLGIGVCWDFGHAHIAGIKQSEGIAYVGDRLKVIHINDNFATEDEHIPPFVGNIDWRDAMHGLSLVGFDGLMNFEVLAYRIPEDARELYAEYILKAANKLMSYIE